MNTAAERIPTRTPRASPGPRAARAGPGAPLPARAARAARPPALAVVLVPLLLGACGVFEAPVVQRGNRVTADQLREITPGVQTKTDVRAALGSPTQTGMFGDDEWYYISSTTRQRPGRQSMVGDRHTVVVEFDRGGVVRRVRTLGEDDARPVEMVARETPVPGNERTFLQALFGNVGRFGAGALGAQQQPVTPGVGGLGQAR
jgi:outer membrane protein assembly factor BamE (lipoprotein component of BamABCDE complex)